MLCCCSNHSEQDTYDLLSVCLEDFYLDQGSDLNEELIAFEKALYDEEHLHERSGYGYLVLLRKLVKETYFSPPLKIEDFESSLLYENPENIFDCANKNFGLDSLTVAELNIFSVSQEISEIVEKEEFSIQSVFDAYANKLTAEEMEQPYVKQTILLLFYRWYFTSKYNREIPIDLKSDES